MTTILPRPTVDVTPAADPAAPSGSLDVAIVRDGKTIAKHRVDGATREQIVRDTAEKLIGDPRVAEALP